MEVRLQSEEIRRPLDVQLLRPDGDGGFGYLLVSRRSHGRSGTRGTRWVASPGGACTGSASPQVEPHVDDTPLEEGALR